LSVQPLFAVLVIRVPLVGIAQDIVRCNQTMH
jgi:hypothetical protein